MIRHATRHDVPAMVGMARRFHEASPASGLTFSPQAAAAVAMAAIDSASCLALILDLGGPVGALVASLMVYPLGTDLLAKESVFWIEPTARGRWAMPMIKTYEAWASGMGARAVGLSCFADGRTQKLFARAGFEPTEIHSIKGL